VILDRPEINTGFATDAGVSHGKQRGWYQDKVYAPLESGSTKPSQIADHTASDYDKQRMTVKFSLRQLLPYQTTGLKVLVSFTGWDNDQVVLGQLTLHLFITMNPGCFVG